MAKEFIHYDHKNGIEYATIHYPMRVNGKKINKTQYLGKVIDKYQGIFKSRSKGVFKFTLEDGYSEYELSVVDSEEKLILDFGDIFLLVENLKKTGIFDIIAETLPEAKDTIIAMTVFKVLSQNANCYAGDWWEGSYARLLFPHANLSSQRLSEFLKELGEEAVQRRFFEKYLRFLCRGDKHKAILIDSTGLANKVQFSLAAISTHSGKTNRETRLILAVDRETCMPLFFRYVAGNIVDVTTLRTTIAELAQYGVETKLTIVDAGYYCEDNIKSLLADNIAFLTRLHSNRVIYKDLLREHIGELMEVKYLTKHHQRLVYIKRVEVFLAGHKVYAYIAIDVQRKNDEAYRYLQGALDDKQKGKLTDEQIESKLESLGVFVLICTECIDSQDILPMYYTRQAIEQIFDVDKNNLGLLPLRVHNEETFRGHLMLTFMASVAYLNFNANLKKDELNATGVLANARNLKCKVYNNVILVKEPAKITRQASKTLGIKIPERIKF